MTGRKTIDEINSDDLDQLYDRLEKLAQTIAAFPDANDAANLAHARAQRDEFVTRAKRAEATLARLRDSAASLHSRGIDAMSAGFILDIIDGRRDEPARTIPNNPATDAETTTRDAVTLHRQGLLTTTELYAVIGAAPTPGEAATQATETP